MRQRRLHDNLHKEAMTPIQKAYTRLIRQLGFREGMMDAVQTSIICKDWSGLLDMLPRIEEHWPEAAAELKNALDEMKLP